MPESAALKKPEPTPTKVQEELSAEKMFADFQRDGFRLRAPALPSELFRFQRLTAVGLCLDPVIRPGDELYIDTTNPDDIQHGDLTLIEWTQEIVQAWQHGNKRAAWEAKFGAGNEMSRSIKLAWQFPRSVPEEFRQWYWACREGISKEAVAKPLGRVVAVVRGGKYLSGDIVHHTVSLASIDDNAVSQIISDTVPGTQSVTAGIGLTADADWNAVAITTTGFAIAIDATGTFAVAGIGGLVVCLLTVRRDGSDIGSVSFDMAAAWLQVLAINSSNPAAWTWPVTLSLVDMPAAGAHTYTIHLHVTCSVGTHDQVIDGTNTMLKVREIKK